ncbi:MFS transporter [Sagittula sp. SSi028]|uniref:MFS transporter n=1 Tax=Sagittula sp. SSi028 TaxID=3400636 RepID=UPI003AF9AD4F
MHVSSPRLAVSAAFALNGALLGAWAARVPAVVDRFALSEAALGLLLLGLGLGALASFPLAGRGADRHGAYGVTCVLAVVYALGLLAVGLAPTVPLLAVALVFFGAGHGAMDVTMNAWAAEVERHAGKSIMPSFHAMWSLGAGVGAAGGWYAVRTDLGLGAHFVATGVLCVAVFGPLMMTRWTSDTTKGGQAGLFTLPKGPLIAVGLIALCGGTGEGAVVDWSALYLTEVVGTSAARGALGFAVFSVTMVAMRLSVGRLITRYGAVAVARGSGLSAAAGVACLMISPGFGTAMLGYVLMGMGYAAIIPLAISRAAADPHIPPGQAIASVATLGYGAMLLGPPSIGFLAEAWGLRLAFGLVGTLAICVIVAAGALRTGR